MYESSMLILMKVNQMTDDNTRLYPYLVCLYADELDFYHKHIKGIGWKHVRVQDKMRLRRKAIQNGLFECE
jgi:hypothetical protein